MMAAVEYPDPGIVEMGGEPVRAHQGLGLGIGHLSLSQGDVDPSVLSALVLDLPHDDHADLGRARDVGAAAGLQVDALNLHEPYQIGRASCRERVCQYV